MEYSLSVIIPVYNAKDTLTRSLRSLERQTLGFDKIELIIVDDCSTDGGGEMIAEYADRKPNVKTFKMKENSGYDGPPRNAVLDAGLVTAPYLMFLDADDELEPDACEFLFSEIEKGGADLVGGYYSEFSEDGHVISEISDKFSKAREGVYSFEAGFAEFEPIADPFWCKIYKTDIIDEYKLRFGGKYTGGDTVFLVRYLLRCESARYIKKRVYRYVMRESSLSHAKGKNYFLRVPDCYDTIYQDLKEAGRLDYFNLHMNADHFLRLYSVTPGFSEDDTREVLERWWELLKYTAKNKLVCHSPAVRTIVRDAARDDFDSAVYHMLEFRALEDERRAQLDDIFSSRTWKIAQKLVKLIKRS